MKPIFLLLICGLATGGAFAQDIERFLPRSAAGSTTEPSVTSAAEKPVAEATASDEAVGTINGIYLVPRPGDVRLDHPPAITGVKVIDHHSDDFIVPAAVTAALKPFVGGPLSLKSVQEINREAVLAYRKAGLPVVDIGFPEQNVSTGVLQLVVIIGKAGEVKVETERGTRYFDDKIYLRSFTTTTGDVLREQRIIDDLNYLNRNPYRRVNLVYTPGDGFGEADLILKTEEARPWMLYAGYENNGTEFVGEDRFLFGGEWGNAFGLDHIMGYQYTTTGDFDSLHAHAATYRIPIWQLRHELRFLAAYVEAEGELVATSGEVLASSGESVQLSASYLIPLPRFFGYTGEAELGFDFKSTNNGLEFGGLEVFENSAETYQFFIGENFSKQQRFGNQRISHRLVWSPGDLSSHNTDEYYESLRAFASSDYVYWNADFAQTVELPHGFTALLEVEGQISNASLLPSETMVLGGHTSVRGFEQNLLLADEAVNVTLELYAPSIPIVSALGGIVDKESSLANLNENARLFGFYDQAWGRNVDLLPGEVDSVSLGGAGIGIDYRLGERLSLRAAHAWQVDEDGFEDGRNRRWHISATTRW